MKKLTDEEKAALNADIPREAVQTKPGRGGLSYVAGWWVQDQANQILGPDGWSQETISKRVVYGPIEIEKKNSKGETYTQWLVIYEAHVRVTIGGATRDGCACGSGEGSSLPDAMHGALGEAETDATKRALKSFSRRLGLALYEKPAEDGSRTHVDSRPEWAREAMQTVSDLRAEAEAGNGSLPVARKAVAEVADALIKLPPKYKRAVLEDLMAVASLVTDGDAESVAKSWITGQKPEGKAA